MNSGAIINYNNSIDNKLLDLISLAQTNATASNKAIIKAKDLANKFNCSVKTVRRYLQGLNSKVVTSVEAVTGRNGGFEVTFDVSTVAFYSDKESYPVIMKDKVGDLVKGLSEELPLTTKEDKKVVMEKKVTKKALKEARGKLMERLNSELKFQGGKPTWNQFSQLADPETSAMGYILGRVYSMYRYLAELEFAHFKGDAQFKAFTDEYSVFGNNEGLFNSSILTNFKNFFLYCLEEKINPVYYLSALTNRALFVAKDHGDKVMFPWSNALMSDFSRSTFDTMVKYDNSAFKDVAQGEKHRTIMFQDNIFIKQMELMFEGIMSDEMTLPELGKDIIKSQLNMIEQDINLAYAPKEDFAKPEEYTKGMMTQVMAPFLKSIYARVDKLDSISDNKKQAFNRELGLMFASEINGHAQKGHLLMASEVLTKSQAKIYKIISQGFQNYEGSDEVFVRILNSAIGTVNSSLKMNPTNRGDLMPDDLMYNAYEELLGQQQIYVGLDILGDLGSIYAGALGMEVLSIEDFYAIMSLLGDTAIPVNKYNTLDIPQIVEKLRTQTKRLSYNDFTENTLINNN